MDKRSRTSPDGDPRATGASDCYLAEVVRQRARPSAADESVSRPGVGQEWDGQERRSDEVSCFDPYLVGLARGGRSSS